MLRIAILLLIVSLPLMAGGTEIIDWALSTATLPPDAAGASIYVTPNAGGVPFTAAFASGGGTVDATITLTLVNAMGDPIQGYPYDDIWLETTEEGLVSCTLGSAPEGSTDANGQTSWTLPLTAGGCSEGEGLLVYVAGAPLLMAPMDLTFNSADMNGDLEIDLTDISLFTQALAAGGYAGDFNFDGVINLSDIARFTDAIGGWCC